MRARAGDGFEEVGVSVRPATYRVAYVGGGNCPPRAPLRRTGHSSSPRPTCSELVECPVTDAPRLSKAVASCLAMRAEKAPSGRLPDGTPYYGHLGQVAYDADEDKVQCHLCGRWFRAVGGSHLSRVHGWTVERYREAFQLLAQTPTVAAGTSALYRDHARRGLAAGDLRPLPGVPTSRNTPGEQPVPRWRSLGKLRPDLVAQLHPTRNGELDVFTLGEWSQRKLWWRCPACGHEWRTSVRMRRVGRGCPRCGRQRTAEASRRPRVKSLGEMRPDLAAELHPTLNSNLDPHATPAWSRRALWWLCSTCGHAWRTDPNNRNGHGSGCPACARRHVPYERTLAAVRPDLAGELRDLDPATVAASSHQPVWWRCSDCGLEWSQRPAGRRPHGTSGCRSCRAYRRWTTSERSELAADSAPSAPVAA